MSKSSVKLYDSTLRDCAQTKGVNFSLDDKYIFYSKLDENHRARKIYRHEIGNYKDDDELIFEVPENEVKKTCEMIKKEMSGVSKSDLHAFSIPLTVDLNSGDNWGTLHWF